MGTHPIFESDFDCLTDVCFVLTQLKMRYVAAYLLAQLSGNDAPDASLNFLARPLMMFLLKVKKNLPLFHLVVVLPQLLVVPLPPVVLKMLQLLKPRRNHHPRMKTKIWDSVFSTKK